MCRRATSRMRKKNRNPASKESFFFPALPDKCETWSVNNWNEPVIEIKFPQNKKPTTNPTKTTRQATHTHKPRHEPGKSVREIPN